MLRRIALLKECGPSLIDPAINIQHYVVVIQNPLLQGTDHQTKRAPISRRALFLGTALDTIPERCGGGR